MRYLPLTDTDRADMLAAIGAKTIDELFVDIPADKRVDGTLDLPSHRSELAVESALKRLAAKNVTADSVPFFVGAGAYKHHVPATVDHLIQRSEFLTSYTPYQPEVSQGTLQVLFEFQTQVAELTGMEVANASMYDGSTAAAEAVLMANRVTKRRKAIVAGGVHPHYREVIKTVVGMADDELVCLEPDPGSTEYIAAEIDEDTACIVVQSPSFFGHLLDLKPLAEEAHAKGALLVAIFTEAVALAAIEPPGAQGADIVVGEGQSLGNPLTFGGPYVGLFATRQKFLRQMPGRICGETVDADGKRGYVLTLSTREQHIRRDKATSNICTNSGLCALAFSIHATLLGGTGLARLATVNHAQTVKLVERLDSVRGVEVLNDTFFNEITLRVDRNAAALVDDLAERGILAGVPVSRLLPGTEFDDLLILAVTECVSDDDIEALCAALSEDL